MVETGAFCAVVAWVGIMALEFFVRRVADRNWPFRIPFSFQMWRPLTGLPNASLAYN